MSGHAKGFSLSDRHRLAGNSQLCIRQKRVRKLIRWIAATDGEWNVVGYCPGALKFTTIVFSTSMGEPFNMNG